MVSDKGQRWAGLCFDNHRLLPSRDQGDGPAFPSSVNSVFASRSQSDLPSSQWALCWPSPSLLCPCSGRRGTDLQVSFSRLPGEPDCGAAPAGDRGVRTGEATVSLPFPLCLPGCLGNHCLSCVAPTPACPPWVSGTLPQVLATPLSPLPVAGLLPRPLFGCPVLPSPAGPIPCVKCPPLTVLRMDFGSLIKC